MDTNLVSWFFHHLVLAVLNLSIYEYMARERCGLHGVRVSRTSEDKDSGIGESRISHNTAYYNLIQYHTPHEIREVQSCDCSSFRQIAQLSSTVIRGMFTWIDYWLQLALLDLMRGASDGMNVVNETIKQL